GLLYNMIYNLITTTTTLNTFPTRRSSDLLHTKKSTRDVRWKINTHGRCGRPDQAGRVSIERRRSKKNVMNSLTDFFSFTDPSVRDRKSTRLNSSHVKNSYAVFCLKKKTF